MPRLIDTDDRAGVLVAAVNHVLVMEGPAGLSLRRIAAVSGVSTSSILHHLGSREHLLRVAAGQTAKARRWDIEGRAYREGATAFLPFTSDHVLDARAWLAWLELWRSEESLDAMLTRDRRDERALLARVLDFQLTSDALDATCALIDGLTVAMCAPSSPMRVAQGRRLLLDHLAWHGVDLDRDLSPYVERLRDVTPPLPHVSSW